MSKVQLNEILARFGLTIQTTRQTTGNSRAGFYTYEIGVGAPFDTLRKACTVIVDCWGLPNSTKADFCRITFVDNPDHEDHNKPYLLVQSFWAEEQHAEGSNPPTD